MIKLKRAYALALVAVFSLASACVQAPAGDVGTAFESISPLEAYGYVKTLAGPEFAGRLTGHAGYSAAARWAAQKFASWGLKPISPNSENPYLQPYPSPYTVVDRAEMTLFLAKPTEVLTGQETAEEEMKLLPGKDFLPLLFSADGDRTGELVFAGWGITAPDLEYDDYAGLDVEGKYVLCFRGTPGGDRKFQDHDEHRTRMMTAKNKGALGIIYIYPEVLSNPNGDWIEDFTPAMISERVADLVFGEIRTTSAELRKSLTARKPSSFPLRSRLRFDVESKHDPDGIGYNIAGYIEGSDRDLRKECLVIGGHFDHTGSHMGLLFPGANDNASGSATVMEIARAFTRLSPKPKRSVLFVLFGGEEMGLQGSNYFAENLPSPFAKIDAMFNFDMVGEGDGIGGSAGAEPQDFRKAIEEADGRVKTLRRLGVIRSVGVRGSDFAPFFLKGIPTASFSSNGPHLAYHQTGDTIYRINPDIMGDAAKLAFLAAHRWADR